MNNWDTQTLKKNYSFFIGRSNLTGHSVFLLPKSGNPINSASANYCCCLVTKLCLTLLQPHGLDPTRLHCSRDFPGKNTGVGCFSF